MARYAVVGVCFVFLVIGLTWWGLHAKETPKTFGPARLSIDQKEDFILIVEASGQMCAQVLEADQRSKDTYYIECETHSDRLARKAYLIDVNTRKAR